MRRWNVPADAADLHSDALVWDMTLPIITPGRPELKADLYALLARSGIDFVSITTAIDIMDCTVTMQSIANERGFAEDRPDQCVLVDSADDVLRAKAAGKLGIGLHFQGTGPFADDLGCVDQFYKLGVRHALLAYNEKNRVGCGCHVEDTGLTAFGGALVREMNRVGMIVDCAHTGHRTAMEAVAASEAPVIISHTNVRALCAHPRCAADELVRACAAKGGVLGITGISTFLGEGGATPERFVDHVDYVARLVGPQHVGLALDYVYDLETFAAFVASRPDIYPEDGNYGAMQQLSPSDTPRITAELLRRGYAEQEIRGILGENWLRVCRTVWK